MGVARAPILVAIQEFLKDFLLPSPSLCERRCCDARRPSVCVSTEPRLHATLISAAKVPRCTQCSLVYYCDAGRQPRIEQENPRRKLNCECFLVLPSII